MFITVRPAAFGLILLLSLLSCTMRRPASPAERLLAVSAERTASELRRQNELQYWSVQDRLAALTMRMYAETWTDVLDSLKRRGADMRSFFTTARQRLNDLPAGTSTIDGKSAEPFISYLQQSLYVACEQYRTWLGGYVPEARKTIDTLLVLPEGWRDSTATDRYFSGATRLQAQALLSTLEGDAARMENAALSVLLRNVDLRNVNSESWPRALVSLSSTNLRPGEALEVTAGVGLYIQSDQVKVDGKVVTRPEWDGQSVYRFTVPDRAGTYTLPVEITFTDQDGKKETFERTCTYHVLPQ